MDSVTGHEKCPAHADVVVIGGGIIGTSAALELASRGLTVVLCEKGHIAGEQSSRNAGWCRQAGRDEREIPLIVESMRLWRGMNARVNSETGFATCGVLYTARTEAEEAAFVKWIDTAGQYQIGATVVTGEELDALMPGATRKYRCGMLVKSDGRAEPQKAAPAIANAAQALGATILTHCAARGLELAGGRVSAVVTERGTIATDAVILAGGAWSSLFCGNLGIRLPVAKLLVSLMRTEAMDDGAPSVATWTDELCYRRRLDGGFTIGAGSNMRHRVPVLPDSLRYFKEFLPMMRQNWRTLQLQFNRQSLAELATPRRWPLDRESPFENARVLDPAPSKGELRKAKADMARLFPMFENLDVVQSWAGYIDVTPDLIPYIGASDDVPGLVVASGFSGHGFGIGPAAGKLAADIATNAATSIDTHAFRLKRFSDGSPIVLGSEV